MRKGFLDESVIYAQYFDSVKKNHMTEGLIGRKHYYISSVNRASDDEKIVYSLVREEMKITKEVNYKKVKNSSI